MYLTHDPLAKVHMMWNSLQLPEKKITQIFSIHHIWQIMIPGSLSFSRQSAEDSCSSPRSKEGAEVVVVVVVAGVVVVVVTFGLVKNQLPKNSWLELLVGTSIQPGFFYLSGSILGPICSGIFAKLFSWDFELVNSVSWPGISGAARTLTT